MFVFANQFNSSLASPVASGDTSITVSDATGLPTLSAGEVIPLTLNDAVTQKVREIVYVTNITGTTLTVTRAQEGTTAQDWLAGDYIFFGFTAGTVANVNGNVANNFLVKAASATGQAVQWDQVQNLTPIGSQHSQSTGTTNTITTASLTAPCDGILLVLANTGSGSSGSPNGITVTGSLANPTELCLTTTTSVGFWSGALSMTKGQATDITVEWSYSANNASGQTVTLIFIPTP